MERKGYLDTLKFLAIFLIYTTHFIYKFNQDYFSLWHNMPTSLFLEGLSGKFGVSLFAVILGFLAYESGRHRKKTVTQYTVNRYAYFMICGLFINTCFLIFNYLGYVDKDITFTSFWLTTFTISDAIFSTFWCMKSFLIASIVAYIAGNKELSYIEILIITIIFGILGQTWIAACLLGTLIHFVKDNKHLKKAIVQLMLFIIVFIIVKRSESTLTYYIDSLCAIIIILIIANNKILSKIFSNKFTGTLGKNSMAMFLIHTLTYDRIGNIIFARYDVNNPLIFWSVWILCFIVVCLLSFPVSILLNFCSKQINRAVSYILKTL